jgi:hypothetical protein
VQFVAARFSHHDATLFIAHGLADCAPATLLNLRKKLRDAPAVGGRTGIAAGMRNTVRRPKKKAAPKRRYKEMEIQFYAVLFWQSNRSAAPTTAGNSG